MVMYGDSLLMVSLGLVRGVSIIMGKSGSGKTLLANALYMEPVLTIIVIQRGFYVIIIYNTPPQTSSQAQPQS
jgi:predicted ribonuclease YlaK